MNTEGFSPQQKYSPGCLSLRAVRNESKEEKRSIAVLVKTAGGEAFGATPAIEAKEEVKSGTRENETKDEKKSVGPPSPPKCKQALVKKKWRFGSTYWYQTRRREDGEVVEDGPQRMMLQDAAERGTEGEEGEAIFICHESQSAWRENRIYKMYGWYPNFDRWWACLLKVPVAERSFYELCPQRPLPLGFDLECLIEKEAAAAAAAAGSDDPIKRLQRFFALLADALSIVLGYAVTPHLIGAFAVSDGSRPKYGGRKYSYHAVQAHIEKEKEKNGRPHVVYMDIPARLLFDGLLFTFLRKDPLMMVKTLQRDKKTGRPILLPSKEEKDEKRSEEPTEWWKDECFNDSSIISKNRLFRLHGSHKADDPTRTPLQLLSHPEYKMACERFRAAPYTAQDTYLTRHRYDPTNPSHALITEEHIRAAVLAHDPDLYREAAANSTRKKKRRSQPAKKATTTTTNTKDQSDGALKSKSKSPFVAAPPEILSRLRELLTEHGDTKSTVYQAGNLFFVGRTHGSRPCPAPPDQHTVDLEDNFYLTLSGRSHNTVTYFCHDPKHPAHNGWKYGHIYPHLEHTPGMLSPLSFTLDVPSQGTRSSSASLAVGIHDGYGIASSSSASLAVGIHDGYGIASSISYLKLDKVEEYDEEKVRPYDRCRTRILMTKSGMCTQKTVSLGSLLEKFGHYRRILVLSTRVSLAKGMMTVLERWGFVCYLDISDFASYARIVLQYESLWRLGTSVFEPFDLVVIDEAESLMDNTVSKHNRSHIKANAKMFENLVQQATIRERKIDLGPAVVFMDADMAIKSVGAVSLIAGPPSITLQVNHREVLKRSIVLHRTKKCWVRRLEADVIGNLPIVLATGSKAVGELVSEEIMKKHAHPFHFYHSHSDQARLDDFNDPDTKFAALDAARADGKRASLGFTPKVTVGTSITLRDYYERVYAYCTPRSCVPRIILQMTGRVRYPRSTEMHFFVNQAGCRKIGVDEYPTRASRPTPESIKALLASHTQSLGETCDMLDRKLVLDPLTGQNRWELMPTWLNHVYIWKLLEEELAKDDYRDELVTRAKSKGYTVTDCTCKQEEAAEAKEEETKGNGNGGRESKGLSGLSGAEEAVGEESESVVFNNAEMLDDETAMQVERKKSKCRASRSELLALEKYYHQLGFSHPVDHTHWEVTKWLDGAIRNLAACIRCANTRNDDDDEEMTPYMPGEEEPRETRETTSVEWMSSKRFVGSDGKLWDSQYMEQVRPRVHLFKLAGEVAARFGLKHALDTETDIVMPTTAAEIASLKELLTSKVFPAFEIRKKLHWAGPVVPHLRKNARTKRLCLRTETPQALPPTALPTAMPTAMPTALPTALPTGRTKSRKGKGAKGVVTASAVRSAANCVFRNFCGAELRVHQKKLHGRKRLSNSTFRLQYLVHLQSVAVDPVSGRTERRMWNTRDLAMDSTYLLTSKEREQRPPITASLTWVKPTNTWPQNLCGS